MGTFRSISRLIPLLCALSLCGAAAAEVDVVAPKSPRDLYAEATRYYKGDAIPRDLARAFGLYQRAAGQGHTASQIQVAQMYARGEGVQRDDARALDWYRKAADKGYALAQKAVGDFYRIGRAVAQDYAAAAGWYKKAAEQGYGGGLCMLGYLYARGWGVVPDMKKAKTLLEQGMAQDNACAQHYLAFLYRNALITLLPDTGKATELDQLAANNGDPEAQYNTGYVNELGWLTYATDKDALHWYQLSAEAGYPPAMERLAAIYANGLLKVKPDAAQAETWQKRAKEAWTLWGEPRPADPDTRRYKFMPRP
ncbi:MAG: sel1 repeat family protein [Burkholderiaceae bacterium]|jgi:TPR repeat protein|nr:sel1 repeat family protein [Burkholderiaceae bacterium]